jgi:hypothetical protein
MVPNYIKQNYFSESNFASAIEYLETKNIYKYSNKEKTIYYIKTIGNFVDCDEDTKIYTFTRNCKNKYVEYIIDNIRNDKYHVECKSKHYRERNKIKKINENSGRIIKKMTKLIIDDDFME